MCTDTLDAAQNLNPYYSMQCTAASKKYRYQFIWNPEISQELYRNFAGIGSFSLEKHRIGEFPPFQRGISGIGNR